VTDAPVSYGTLSHSRSPRVETFDSEGSADQKSGTTPGGPRSVPTPTGVTATPVHAHAIAEGGAPDQRGGDVGAIPQGFALPADDGGFEAALAETKRVLDAVARAVEDRGPDPDLAQFRGSVRPAVEDTVAMWDERAKAHYADPARSRFKDEALQEMDREFQARRQAAMDQLRDKLAASLSALENAKYDRAPAMRIAPEHDDKALRLAAELSHLSPATGLGRIGEFLGECAEDPALAFVGRRFLREIFQRPGTPWTRNTDLYRALAALDGIVAASDRLSTGGEALAGISATRTELTYFFDALNDPIAGRFALGMQASGTGRVGDAPAFFSDPPTTAPARSSYDAIEGWRPFGGGIPRGRGGAVSDDGE
jgi:hypothetical protein